MENVDELAKLPKQARSRRSFEKAIDAAVSLVIERRSDAFTLAEVCERAGVSTGAIYGRVASKADLLRIAHAREMERLTQRTLAAFVPGATPDEDLSAAIGRVIRATGEVLRQNAPVLAGFRFLGNRDPEVAEVGKIAFHRLVDVFSRDLMAHQDEMTLSDPGRAVRWSFTVVFSVTARWLDLGSEPAAAGEGDWDDTLRQLAEIVYAYLAGDAHHPYE